MLAERLFHWGLGWYVETMLALQRLREWERQGVIEGADVKRLAVWVVRIGVTGLASAAPQPRAQRKVRDLRPTAARLKAKTLAEWEPRAPAFETQLRPERRS